ncbi:MAG: transposase [Desulfurivibrionaceae bacterium]
MARANRHFIPGQIWHITHRCHERDFLLKLVKDRRTWRKWLYEAKVRYDLSVLNYIVTSNHVHLLVLNDSGWDVIPKSMQLIAGRTGQEYNYRKRRKGAFWEDRYHATAIEAEKHFLRCLIYIDLNMVRAGMVNHPVEWPDSGYQEIQAPRRKCGVISYRKLAEKAGFHSYETFKKAHADWVNEAIENNHPLTRQQEWAESIAVGSENFTAGMKEKLGIRAKGRTITGTNDDSYQLREASQLYADGFDHKMVHIGPQNGFSWKTCHDISGR